MTVPYTFGTATTSIPLSNLDANFNTPITLGNTSIYLGNTTTTIGNLTLTNATISSGTVNITNVTVTTANVTNITVTGTANIATGNITTLTSTSITDSGLTSGRVTFAGASGLLSDNANFTYNGTALTLSASSAISGVFNRTTSSGATVQIQVVGGSVGTLGSDTGGNGIFDIAATSSMYLRSTGASSIMAFSTNNTEQMRISSAGVVDIGVTGLTANANGAVGKLVLRKPNEAVGNNQITRMLDFAPYYPGFDEAVVKASISSGVDTGTQNGQLGFMTATTGVLSEKMRILANGNVGIGTSSPLVNLDVVNSSAPSTGIVTTLRLNHAGTSIGDGPRLLFTSGTSTTGGCAIAGYGTALNAADMLFYAGGNTERMRISSTGSLSLSKVGGPPIIRREVAQGSYGLIVQGNAADTIDDTNPGASITIGGGPLTDTFEGNITLIAYGAVSASGNRNAIEFRNRSGTNTTQERMRIDYLGNLLVGATSAVSGAKLEVTGTMSATSNISATGGGFFSTRASGNSPILDLTQTGVYTWDLVNTATTGVFSIRGNTNPYLSITNATGIVTMQAYGAGAATFSAAGVISSVSDETWKTKDGVPTNPDVMLQKLEPGYWFYNEEKAPTFGADRQLGFYAQNVHEAIGAEAAPTPEEGKPWGYYDRSVLAVTVMSLKNALNTIEELKQRIATLENK
jgi:hypothetical protein